MQNRNKGCCPSVHAKTFEIILIIGFILSIILLIVNLVLSLWCFKYSYALFIIEIGLIALNFISIILSIILRVWRSDGSVHNKNFSSSNSVAIFNIVLVIINLLASIAEEVLFSFVISYLSKHLNNEKSYSVEQEEITNIINDFFDHNNPPIIEDSHESEPIPNYDFIDDLIGLFEDIDSYYLKLEMELKKKKYIGKIMNKNYEKMFIFDKNDEKKNLNIMTKKIKLLKIFPWIAINFNIFIQFLMVIFIIILIGRINLKSDFGFAQTENNNQSVQNRMLNRRKSSSRRRSSGIKIANADSDATKLEIKKKKKKKKKKK